MKRILKLVSSFICMGISISFLLSCSLFPEKGTVSLSLTDAPIADSAAVEGVYITITGIEYIRNEERIAVENFEVPEKINLLDLTNGVVTKLSDTLIEPGLVSQIRFMIDADEKDDPQTSSPGCYIVIDSDGEADHDGVMDEGDEIEPLYVPSGSETGYKATGAFTVPINGHVDITADFDVRKSVVSRSGGNSYLLKPVIRLIVNDQAGSIQGTFVDLNDNTYDSYTIFVYDAGTYTDSEATVDSDAEADSEVIPIFNNAISSAQVIESEEETEADTFVLSFLADGTYDLIITGVATDGTYTVLDSISDVEVIAGETTTVSKYYFRIRFLKIKAI